MKKITLFVGDCDESLAIAAKQLDGAAVLIDSTNYKKFQTAISEYTAYTSLADLPKDPKILYEVLLTADLIYYCPPQQWSDQKNIDLENFTNCMQGLTEFYLHAVNKIKNNVIGLNFSLCKPEDYLKLLDLRKSSNSQLWVVGCSTTAGVGVEKNQTYGYLLSQKLNLPISTLATPGSSISWAADQILRSDIQENDIVVWGLTSENRLTFWDEDTKSVSHLLPNIPNNHKLNTDLPKSLLEKLLVHKTNFFTSVQRIFEVVNFCKKTKAKLLMFNIHSSHLLNISLCNTKEFFIYVHEPYTYADTGTDNQHPGPIQHKLYADFCQQQLKNLNYI